MTLDAHIMENPAAGPPAAADPRIAVAEMWLCMLGGLREVAKRFSRFLVHEIMPFGPEPERPFLAFRFSGKPITALKRVMRAARFAAILCLKIQKQIAAWKAGAPFDLEAFLAEAPRLSTRSNSGGYDAAGDEEDWDEEDWEEEEWEDLEEWDNLYEPENLVERERFGVLDGCKRKLKEDKYEALLRGPLKDAIAAICKDLGIKPDWSLWTVNGFPAPPGGGVEDWIAFFAPAPKAAAAPRPSPVRPSPVRPSPARPSPDEIPPCASPPPDPRDEAAYQAWRRHGFPRQRWRDPSPI
jgi:hypothetical protein